MDSRLPKCIKLVYHVRVGLNAVGLARREATIDRHLCMAESSDDQVALAMISTWQ